MSEDNAQGAEDTTATEATATNDSVEVKALKSEAAQRRIENKELKEQLETFLANQKSVDEKTLSDNEEFKTLADQYKGERDTLTEQLKGLTGTIALYTTRDEEELATLRELVPEAQRGILDSENIPLTEKLILAKQLAVIKPEVPGARNAGPFKNQTLQDQYDQAVKDGNVTEQIALKNEMYKKG